MTEALAWLAPRLDDAPAGLAERVRAAVAAADAGTVAEVLAAAGVACLREGLEGGSGRGAALDLLAADALLTHACEAAAESDPAGLAAFCRRWGVERLAALVAGSAA